MKQVLHGTVLLATFVAFAVASDDSGRRGGRNGGGREPAPTFHTDIPEHLGSVILGRPTDRSVTASVMVHQTARIGIAYGAAGGPLHSRTEVFAMAAGEPREIVLDGLGENAKYEYRVIDADTDAPLLPSDGRGSFRTSRTRGSVFSFAVMADSHLDEFTELHLYRRTLENVLDGRPDFFVDLGDTFMTGKHPSRESAASQYAAQRYWFGLVGHSVPVFLALGNHDGEETHRPGSDAADGLAVWSNAQRKRLFPNPVPSDFYFGNGTQHIHAGELQNYYAWEWGDALFVVLDPYWYSATTRSGREPWNMTLGNQQYDWLAKTLRISDAKFKFVFVHQLVGGWGPGDRGGVEGAGLYEWGGRNAAGKEEFASRRPGWEKPIHDLLVENGVQIVFRGHDHFFARQELDGVVYQLVPQPAHRNFRKHHAVEYGYRVGDFLPNSGHLRVQVSPERVTVQYIRTGDDRMVSFGVRNGEPAFTYACAACVPEAVQSKHGN